MKRINRNVRPFERVSVRRAHHEGWRSPADALAFLDRPVPKVPPKHKKLERRKTIANRLAHATANTEPHDSTVSSYIRAEAAERAERARKRILLAFAWGRDGIEQDHE